MAPLPRIQATAPSLFGRRRPPWTQLASARCSVRARPMLRRASAYTRTYPAPGFTVLPNFSASRAVLLKRWAIRLAAIAQETPTLARDPPGEMSRRKPGTRERQGRRQPAEPVDAPQQLAHGLGALQHAAVGQDQPHCRRAH